MVSLRGTVIPVDLELALGRLKTVPEQRHQKAAALFG